MILAGAIRLGGAAGPAILTLVLCETLISFGWMLYIAQKVFLGPLLTPVPIRSDPPWAFRVTLIALMIGCLTAPFVGMPLVQFMGT